MKSLKLTTLKIQDSLSAVAFAAFQRMDCILSDILLQTTTSVHFLWGKTKRSFHYGTPNNSITIALKTYYYCITSFLLILPGDWHHFRRIYSITWIIIFGVLHEVQCFQWERPDNTILYIHVWHTLFLEESISVNTDSLFDLKIALESWDRVLTE